MAKNKKSTQQHIPIAGIRDNAVILQDGSLRGVLLTSSLNFALKSEEEQNATIGGYVSFLNSFAFPIQIVVQSRKLNIDKYLDKLDTIAREQTNELLKMQTKEYRQFVKELLDLESIMAKRFYVVVPYDPASDTKKSFFSRLGSVLKAAQAVSMSEKRFQERRQELIRRMQLIAAGLSGMGLNAVPLETQALIELYYTAYNPVEAATQQLAPLEKLRVEERFS